MLLQWNYFVTPLCFSEGGKPKVKHELCFLFQLVVSHRLPWDLLPPKKLIGNLNASHIEKRKVALDKYLKTVLNVLLKMPIELVEFLEFDRFVSTLFCKYFGAHLSGVHTTWYTIG